MAKILGLRLKNFEIINTAMGKREVELDFSKSDDLICVLMGKMGSGKTALLSHLQPFATVGTLDLRNGQSLIIPNENGEKVFVIEINGDIFTVEHKYTWKKDSHHISSFIQKNGEELNPNGNQTSFKELVEIHMGITMSYLTIIRLGANVKNLIELSSLERKSYISEMLKEAEFYNLFYKIMKDENRMINSKIGMLGNKLRDLSSEKVEDFKDALIHNEKLLQTLERDKNKWNTEFYSNNATIETTLKGKSFDDYTLLLNEYERQQSILNSEILSIKDEIESLSGKYTTETLNLAIIEATSKKNSAKDNNLILEAQYESNNKILNKLLENKSIVQNSTHIDEMQKAYDLLLTNVSEYEVELKDFNCPWNTTMIKTLMSDVSTVCSLLLEIFEFGSDSIKHIFNSDSSVIKMADKKIEKLNRKKFFLQNDITNIKYAETYKANIPLYIPPFCGKEQHESCPFYRTHPSRVKAREQKEKQAEVQELKNKIEVCDAEISRYMDYPILYNKMSLLKRLWEDVTSKLKKLGILKENSLYKVLTIMDNREWYDNNLLNLYLEKCEKREKYYELTEKIQSMKAELDSLNKYDLSSITEKINFYESNLSEIKSTIRNNERIVDEMNAELDRLNDYYLKLSKIDSMKVVIADKTKVRDDISSKILEMKSNILSLQSALSNRDNAKKELANIQFQLNEVQSKTEKLKTILNDIDYCMDEYNESLKEQKWIKTLLDATSNKEGIPLIFVKMFMERTRESINEMISEVFKDDIEIQEFIIEENKFEIPYIKNGVLISDIKYMSQGERSIINIALSFALMELQMCNYNIPLLDEVDGPLYKDDRAKFFAILFKYCKKNYIQQCFLISHNNMADGFPCTVLLTSDENVDSKVNKVIQV